MSEQPQPIAVTDERGRVVVVIHNPTPKVLARVIASHPEQETLIRGVLADKAPEAYNALP